MEEFSISDYHIQEKSPQSAENGELPQENVAAMSPKISDWVAVVYDDNWYVGQVTDKNEVKVQVNFVMKSEKPGTYKWPSRWDEIWITYDELLLILQAPKLVGKSKSKNKRCFSIPKDTLDLIDNTFNALK